jgi:ElaB/YqjD/DUF883 family membrane-anchored ribosome-binding protein
MESLNKQQSSPNSHTSHLGDAASNLLNEGNKLAHEFYEEGLKKIDGLSHEAGEYSEQLLKTVRDNPMKAVLIAGGIGFLLSALLRK